MFTNLTEPIHFEKLEIQYGYLGVIVLNRTAVLNALNHDMISRIFHQLNVWEVDQSIQAVLIVSNHDTVFCVGGDIKEMYARRARPDRLQAFFQNAYQLNQYIYTYSKPYIAWLDGCVMGGGAGISLHGSHVIVTEQVTFAMPETGIGFFPDAGMTYLLSRCNYPVGDYIALTGESVSFVDMCRLGLVRYHIPRKHFGSFVQSIQNSELGKSNKQRYETMDTLCQLWSAPYAVHQECCLADALCIECFAQANMQAIYQCVAGRQTIEAKQLCQRLGSKSPISLFVTHEALARASTRDLTRCLQMEYQVACQFIRGKDLFEGIRALLIDRDRKPTWQVKHLSAIQYEQDIAPYFHTRS